MANLFDKNWLQRNAVAQPLLTVGVGFVTLWALGCGGSGSSNNSYRLSVTRVKAINLGVIEYMNDYDDCLPLAGKWMDEDMPYAKDAASYHSPAIGAAGFGYAFNSAVAGMGLTQFASPSTEVTIFDSTDLSRNATDAIVTEPSPPRYGHKNTIGFLDGHVQDEDTIGNPPPTLYSQSQSRLKQVNLAMLMYANDWNGDGPLANQWVDELLPYTKSDLLFHSPAVQLKDPAAYGYALNIDIVGLSLPNLTSPSTTLSFFDSTALNRNATASTLTLPNPPRYGKVNTLGYADGHVHP